LLKQAERIGDAEWRRAFLDISGHALTLALANELGD
jgi:hypothetical protein